MTTNESGPRPAIMNQFEVKAFLQWLLDQQNHDGLVEVGEDTESWIDGNGFNANVVISGLKELEQKTGLSPDLPTLVLQGRRNKSWIEIVQRLLAAVTNEGIDHQSAGGTSRYASYGLIKWQQSKFIFSSTAEQSREANATNKGGYSSRQQHIDHEIQREVDQNAKELYREAYPNLSLKKDWDNTTHGIIDKKTTYYDIDGDIAVTWYTYQIKGPKRTIDISFTPINDYNSYKWIYHQEAGYYPPNVKIEYTNDANHSKDKSWNIRIGNLISKQHTWYFDILKREWDLYYNVKHFGSKWRYVQPWPTITVLSGTTGRLIVKSQNALAKANEILAKPFVIDFIRLESGRKYNEYKNLYDYLQWLSAIDFRGLDTLQKILIVVDIRSINHQIAQYNFSQSKLKQSKLYKNLQDKWKLAKKITPWYIYQKGFELFLCELFPYKLQKFIDSLQETLDTNINWQDIDSLPLEAQGNFNVSHPESDEIEVTYTWTGTATFGIQKNTNNIAANVTIETKSGQAIISISKAWQTQWSRNSALLKLEKEETDIVNFYSTTAALISHPLLKRILRRDARARLHIAKQRFSKDNNINRILAFLKKENVTKAEERQDVKTVND